MHKTLLISLLVIGYWLLGTAQTTDHWRLLWDPNTESDMDYYEVWRGSTADPFTMTRIDTVHHVPGNLVDDDGSPAFQYIDDSLVYGESIYYALKAVDQTGRKSDFSSVASAAVPLLSIPDIYFAENEFSRIVGLEPFVFDDQTEGHIFTITGLDSFHVVFSGYGMNVMASPTFSGSETGQITCTDPDGFKYVQAVLFSAEGEKNPNPTQGPRIKPPL